MAGGEGTRLRPITEKIPKTMVEINGKPFLEHQLELLAKNDILEVVLLVGRLWEKIKNYFGNVYCSPDNKKINIEYSVEPRYLGTGGAVKNAEKYLSEYFFVVYGDTYLPLDYQDMANLILSKEVTGAISVYSNKDKMVNNNVTVDDNTYILKYDKYHETAEMNGVEAGVLVFNKDVLRLIPSIEGLQKEQKISLEIDIYPKLIAQHQLLGYRTDLRFYDMGTPERIKIISEVLK